MTNDNLVFLERREEASRVEPLTLSLLKNNTFHEQTNAVLLLLYTGGLPPVQNRGLTIFVENN